MNQCNNENLYAATRDFLACITDAQMLYDSKKLTQFEESMVRTKLRDCFEQYMQTLSVKENNFGPIMTRRSREFVEVEINAFIETANQYNTYIVRDIHRYKEIIDDSRKRSMVLI